MTVSKKGTEGGRPEYEPSAESRMIVRALAANGCTHRQIANYIHISPTTLRKHYKAELRDGFDTIYAGITGKLVQKALAGHPGSIFFWLERKGGWRRTDRTEVSGPDGKPVEFHNIPNDGLAQVIAALRASIPAGAGGAGGSQASQDEPGSNEDLESAAGTTD